MALRKSMLLRLQIDCPVREKRAKIALYNRQFLKYPQMVAAHVDGATRFSDASAALLGEATSVNS